jgi:hypothetical protein
VLYDFAVDAVVAGLWLLAAARVTRLLTKDAITDFVREWAYRRSRGGDTLLTYFVQCPWCIGMWVALSTGWLPLWLTDRHIALWPLVALAASYLIGVSAENLESADDFDVEITDAE